MTGKPIPITTDPSDPDSPAGAIPVELFGAGGGGGEVEGLTIGTTDTVVGEDAGSSLTSGSHRTILGSNAGSTTTTGVRQVIIGSSAQASTASAMDTVAVGHDAKAGSRATGVGASASATGSYSTALGRSASATGLESVAVGSSTKAPSDQSVAVGHGATISPGSMGKIAIGRGAKVEGGPFPLDGKGSIAIGDEAVAGPTQNSVAIGARTATTHDNQVAFGERDIEVQSSEFGLVLKSPNGTRYRILVDDSGDISATPLT